MIPILGEAILAWRSLNTQGKPAFLPLQGKAKRWRGEEPIIPTRQRDTCEINRCVGLWWKGIVLRSIRLRIEHGREPLPGPEEPGTPTRLPGIIAAEVIHFCQLSVSLNFHMIGEALWKAADTVLFRLPQGTFDMKQKGRDAGLFIHFPGSDLDCIVTTVQGMHTR
jgi:hypothetical protein